MKAQRQSIHGVGDARRTAPGPMTARSAQTLGFVPSALDRTLILGHGERKARSAGLDRGLIAAMRIRLNNPALTGDLVDYLRQNECEAMAMGPNLVAVSLSHALPYDAARLELGVHLGDWALENGNAGAVILD